jgi:hypothetical protein
MWKPIIMIPVATALAAGLASGCDRGSAPASPPANAPASAPAPAVAPAAPVAAVAPELAAAEPFEALTETAFSASGPDLAAAAAKAEAAATAVRGHLPVDAARQLDARLAEIRAALQANNRADLAIASVEAYRTLVSAAPRARVPVEVSLLDYAGFRYQADAAAQPVRWADMAEAAAFARDTWKILSPQIGDTALRARFDRAVAALGAAVQKRDRTEAVGAATTELALVDELEAYFNTAAPR